LSRYGDGFVSRPTEVEVFDEVGMVAGDVPVPVELKK
jgi:hypothetical protein